MKLRCINSVQKEDIEQKIMLDVTQANYGARQWLLCPSCGRRKAVLHFHRGYFACRSCHDLNYTSSQYSGSIDYYHYQLRKLSKRLGTEYEPLEMEAPPKPKGMHEKTYFDLSVKYHRLAIKREAAFIAGPKRILGWK